MPATGSSSLSPPAEPRLVRVPIGRVRAHPANSKPDVGGATRKARPQHRPRGALPAELVARPHPDHAEDWQLLDGHQRLEALGHANAVVFPWPCDDAEALVLLATLNRLEGEDVPARRADLLVELSALLPPEELALLLPEDAAQINDTIALLDLDAERLLADLELAATRQREAGPRLVSFAVLPEDEAVIEEAIAAAAAGLDGRNTRGRALGLLARRYLDGETDA